MIDDLVLHVESSLGVAVLPDHADDGTSLMQRADVAMYAAKTAHLGVVIYDPRTDGSSTERHFHRPDASPLSPTRCSA